MADLVVVLNACDRWPGPLLLWICSKVDDLVVGPARRASLKDWIRLLAEHDLLGLGIGFGAAPR